jgi:DNA-binding IclR family transcriptional regulator
VLLPNTITSKKTLRDALDGIRAAGFAASDQEVAAERLAVALPVRNEGSRSGRGGEPRGPLLDDLDGRTH